MNKYWDRMRQYRAAMTEDEVEACLNVELMEKGVSRVEQPELEDLAEINLDERDQFYVVEYGGRYSGSTEFNCVFRAIEDAESFIKLEPMISNHEYSVGSEYEYAELTEELKIKPIKLFAKVVVMAQKDELEENKKRKDRNDNLTGRYQKAKREVREATEDLWSDWRKCLDSEDRYTRMQNTLAEYVETCDGNEELAMTFLLKIHEQEEVDEMIEWFADVVEAEPDEVQA